VCEFITAGGLGDTDLPDALAHEGLRMRDALLHDIAALGAFEVTVMHDARIAPSDLAARNVRVEDRQFKKMFTQMLEQVDYIWLIAPETDGVLLELSELCYRLHAQGHVFLGCGYDATLVGTSKTLCFEALQAANIYALPVYAGDALMQADYMAGLDKLGIKKWVAKPEDGAGCEGVRLFGALPDLQAWLAEDNRYLRYLAQPFQQGMHASFSCLCRNGKAWLLSCNEQHIQLDETGVVLTGITINGMLPYWQRFETIARKIAKMLPDALGYIGVDVVIDTENNHKIYVIEINPRLTTSYVGLRAALACNPARLVLDCVLSEKFIMPNIAKNQVEVQLT